MKMCPNISDCRPVDPFKTGIDSEHISDFLLLKYHTRNIWSIWNALKDQYYNTDHDNDFNENESKWSDCDN